MNEENSTGYTSYVYGPTGLLAKRITIDQESNTYYYHKDHLGSTRSVTDNNKTVISTSTYHPFGDADNEEGSEQYLYTGKERDSTGLYYYGARYYDPNIGRFVTRDRKPGRIFSPLTLNKYTYCLNNPIIYIDPDGQDIFKPEWSYHESSSSLGYSFKGIFISFLLNFQKTITKMMAGYSYWKNTNLLNKSIIGVGISLGGAFGGMLVDSIIGVLASALEISLILFNDAAEFYYDLWCNDPTFIALYKKAETYANLLAMGANCEQEATDAHVELTIYMLQQRYGDNWRNHCPSSLLKYYDEMMKRKEEIPDQSSENSSNTTHNSPPGTSIT
jgi:RHS repeat-associated protein